MGVYTASSFRKRLAQIATRVPERVGAIARDLMFHGANATIAATAVDRGELRAGWDATVGGASDYVPPEGDAYPDAAAVLARAVAVWQGNQATPFRRLVLTNNVEHAAVLETGAFVPPDPGPSKDKRPDREGRILVSGGYSTQSPQGMLRAGAAAMVARAAEYGSRLP